MKRVEGPETQVHRVASFVTSLAYDDIPASVTDSVKLRLLDTIGLMHAGLLSKEVRTIACAANAGNTIPKLPYLPSNGNDVTSAAFAGGVLAHALDFDDTHLRSILHPSAVIVPTALAVAGETRCSGRDVLEAMTSGYEVLVRLGLAAYDPTSRNSLYFEKGLHATSICGAVASAAVAARLMGSDGATVAHAMGIAASMGAGLLEANRTGGTVKRLHCGWACLSGVSAARFALQGVTGPPTVFEGRFGFFFHLLGDAATDVDLSSDLGEQWRTPEIVIKPYPANHFTHCAIDAAMDIRSRDRFRLDSVEEIIVGLPTSTMRTVAEPLDQKRRPESGYAARFSAPYCVAAALSRSVPGGLTAEDFSEDAIREPGLLAIADRVRCEPDDTCDAVFPDQFPCIMTVVFEDGSKMVSSQLANRGGHKRPLSILEVREKFAQNTGRDADDEAIAALLSSLNALERQPTTGGLVDRLRDLARAPHA